MGSATNKQRRRKELEKHVATQAANKKQLDDSLAARKKRLKKQDRAMEMAQPSPGTTKVSGEAEKKPTLGERMVITGAAGAARVRNDAAWYAKESAARNKAMEKAAGDAAKKTKETGSVLKGAKEFARSGRESGKQHREKQKAEKK